MFDLINEIGQTLKHNKMRTALTGCAVAWGIFMLIVLLGMSRGVANAADANFDDESMRSLTIWGGTTSKAYRGYKEGRRVELKNSDIEQIDAANIPYASETQAMISVDTAIVSTLKDYISDGMNGVYPKYQKFERAKMIYGRYINDRDIQLSRKVIVLEKTNAESLFGDAQSAVGRKVDAMNLSWQVVGVYENDWRRTSYVPFSTLSAILANGDNVENIRVMLKDIETLEEGAEAEEATRATLGKAHNFSSEDRSAVHIWNSFENYIRQSFAKYILNTVVWVIGLLTLLSGIIGVSNIMFVSVKERTHEIGVRRAIGAKPRSVLVQVVAESVAITALFGYIGIFFGILVTEAINHAFGDSEFIKNPTVDISIALYVTVVLVVVGALAGIFPAIKATKVRPVEALRDE